MIRLSASFFILCVLASQCFGQYVPPPAPIADYYSPQRMPNVATLYVTYCLAGKWPCSEYQVKAIGQLCDPYIARTSRNLDGTPLPGYVYTSWRCDLADRNDKPPFGTSGRADDPVMVVPIASANVLTSSTTTLSATGSFWAPLSCKAGYQLVMDGAGKPKCAKELIEPEPR